MKVVPKSANRADLERQVANLAAEQYGAISRRQLREFGLTDEAVRAGLKSGRLERIYPGAYRLDLHCR